MYYKAWTAACVVVKRIAELEQEHRDAEQRRVKDKLEELAKLVDWQAQQLLLKSRQIRRLQHNERHSRGLTAREVERHGMGVEVNNESLID